jgi:hypothetical protein
MDNLEQRISILEQQMNSFNSFTTLTQEVEGAIRNRLILQSNKSPSSVTASLSAVSVMIPPIGFIKLKNGQNIPVYPD